MTAKPKLTQCCVRVAPDVIVAFEKLCDGMSRNQAIGFLLKRPLTWVRRYEMPELAGLNREQITVRIAPDVLETVNKRRSKLDLSLGGYIERVMRRAIHEEGIL